METIYVVHGRTGEYSDRTEWVVAAYTDEASARQHIEAATKRANELQVLAEKDGRGNIILDNDFDKGMGMDYTGTSYWYCEIELYGDVLEYKLTI